MAQKCFDILNRFGAYHKCDRQTHIQTLPWQGRLRRYAAKNAFERCVCLRNPTCASSCEFASRSTLNCNQTESLSGNMTRTQFLQFLPGRQRRLECVSQCNTECPFRTKRAQTSVKDMFQVGLRHRVVRRVELKLGLSLKASLL